MFDKDKGEYKLFHKHHMHTVIGGYCDDCLKSVASQPQEKTLVQFDKALRVVHEMLDVEHKAAIKQDRMIFLKRIK